jgi:hypothetical protein
MAENIMKTNAFKIYLSLFLLFLLAISGCKNGGSQSQSAQSNTDPLTSWNEGAAKQAIENFVNAVSDPDSPDYVLPADRVATFDNDGTLWAEQPLYFQVFFIFERLKELAPQHPEWKTEQPFKAVLENDSETMKTFHVPDILKLAGVTHTGMTQDVFENAVRKFITTAKHPERGVLFTQLVYQPMLELLAYLRQNDFKVFIVSGGGIDFIRAFSEDVYGICVKWKLCHRLMIKKVNRSISTVLSAAGRFWRSAIPTAICKCCNIPLPDRVLR